VGTQARRERERRRRRRDILDAARELFWEHGYTATTMPEIAAAAELAAGTLYLYFPSKQALYSELLIEGYDLLVERLREAANTGAPARRQAETCIDGFFAFAQETPEYFDIVFFVLHWGGTQSARSTLEPEQVARLEARESACKAIARQVLSQPGSRVPPEDVEQVLDAVWSMLVGVVLYFRKTGPDRFRAVAERAKEIVLVTFFGEE